MIYYDRDKITVQTATEEDVKYLKDNLRHQDVQEIWDADHFTPEQALNYSINNTVFSLSVRIKDVPCVIFGCDGESVIGNKGVVWMLASEKIKDIGFRFVRHSRKFISMMLSYYSYLYNYCSVDNTVSLQWLKSLGAKFHDPAPYGIEQKQFVYFYFTR